MTACSEQHTFSTDKISTQSSCVVTGPHRIHRDALDREWRSIPTLGKSEPTHGETYGRTLIAAHQTFDGSWIVNVTDVREPGSLPLAAVAHLNEFEAGREFQRQVDHWRPIGLAQGLVWLQDGK